MNTFILYSKSGADRIVSHRAYGGYIAGLYLSKSSRSSQIKLEMSEPDGNGNKAQTCTMLKQWLLND